MMFVTDSITLFIQNYFDPRDLIAYLLLLQGIDTLTGLIVSARYRRVSSSVAWRGITRKAGTVVGVFFLMVIEKFIQVQLGQTGDFVRWIVLGFVGVEALSIIENLARLGVIVPSGIKDTLAKVAPVAQPKLASTPRKRKPQAKPSA